MDSSQHAIVDRQQKGGRFDQQVGGGGGLVGEGPFIDHNLENVKLKRGKGRSVG